MASAPFFYVVVAIYTFQNIWKYLLTKNQQPINDKPDADVALKWLKGFIGINIVENGDSGNDVT